MAGYIEKRLYDGEILRYRGQFHWLSHFRAWLALIVLGVVIFGIVFFISEQIRMRTTEFAVTDRRVVLKKGLFSADVQKITLDSIEGSSIRQGLFGHLSINGRGETHIAFPVMAHPATFRAHAERTKPSGGSA